MKLIKMSNVTTACLLGCLAMGTVAPIVHAELPPTAYDEMKSKASEVVEIQVTRVATKTRDTKEQRDISVFADAKVVGVTRSASELKVGDKISLRYMTFEILSDGWVGPSPAPTVQTGKRYHAWLKRAGSHYYIAAQGESLESSTPAQGKLSGAKRDDKALVYVVGYDPTAFINGQTKKGETLEQLAERHARRFHGRVGYIYKNAAFGCSMTLTPDNAAQLAKQPEVISVNESETLQLN